MIFAFALIFLVFGLLAVGIIGLVCWVVGAKLGSIFGNLFEDIFEVKW